MRNLIGNRWVASAAAVGMLLAGYGTAFAETTAAVHKNDSVTMSSSGMSHGKKMSGSMTGTLKGVPSDLLIGAAASPSMGQGNGLLTITSVGMKHTWKIPLAMGANAFQVAIDHNMIYVPTLQGKTYVVSMTSRKVVSSFASPMGARIATLADANHLLILTSANTVTAYSLPSMKQVWQINQGGNTLAVVGRYAYLSSNAASDTSIINLSNGHILKTIPVGMIESSIYDPQHHTLWLANWNNGDMTIVNTMTNRVVKTVQRAEGGGFTMTNMMGSSGGFMQLAVAPSGQFVYAASFSGNIMVYNASANTFEKDIPVKVPMAKLSGIAIDPSGQYAYTTVESQKETVSVSLKTGKITGMESGIMANRWFVVSQ